MSPGSILMGIVFLAIIVLIATLTYYTSEVTVIDRTLYETLFSKDRAPPFGNNPLKKLDSKQWKDFVPILLSTLVIE